MKQVLTYDWSEQKVIQTLAPKAVYGTFEKESHLLTLPQEERKKKAMV